jgi:hypothetical protein
MLAHCWRLSAIEKHPALRLTPELYAQVITRAGSMVMSAGVGKLDKVIQDHERARNQLAGMIGIMRGKRGQTFWLIALPAAAFLLKLLAPPVVLGGGSCHSGRLRTRQPRLEAFSMVS